MACNLCPLQLPKQVAGHGPANPKLIVIGEYPTNDCEVKGIPFSRGNDPRREYANDLVRNALAGIGLDVENEVYLAYALRCNPWHRAVPVKVKPAYRTTCRDRNLDRELREVDCDLILAFGDEAMKSLLPDLEGGIAKNRGRWHETVIGGRKRQVWLTFSVNFIHKNLMYEALQLSNGKLISGEKFNPPGSVGWFFGVKDMPAVKRKIAASEA